MNELVNIISRMQELYYSGLNGAMAILFAVVAVVGLVQCFFGYKLMRVCFAFCGFVIGALGAGIGAGLAADNMAVVIIAALVGGVLGALLLFHVYRLGVFFMNFTLVTVFVFLAGNARYASLIAGVIAGIVIGVVAAIMVRVCTILSTGCAGGVVAGVAIGGIFHVSAIGLVLGVVLTIVGIVFQFKTTKKNKSASAAEPSETVVPTVIKSDIVIAEAVVVEKEVKADVVQSAEMAEIVSTPSKENQMIPKLRDMSTAVALVLKSIKEVAVCLVRCTYYTIILKLKYPEYTH